jgi:SAM-dependent MidA family methyltransferase
MAKGLAQTPLAAQLAARIRRSGPIKFADYMDACLYDPEYGFYSRPEAQRVGHYYTSVDVHPVYGRLLTRQFHEMWLAMDRPEPSFLVEAGAGTGLLAAQILEFAARSLPDYYSALRYLAVEASPARRAAHERSIERHIRAGSAASLPELPATIPGGCIFSNELLDALPVHRVVCEAGALRETWIDLAGDEFVEATGPLSTPAIADYFAVQGVKLAEGQQAEAGIAACRWIEDAGGRLGRGFVLTVDYGHDARELYNERHMRGTLLAYERHRADEDFYRAPGEQDLTAHVNFTALDLWGKSAGLERTGIASQGHFLLALARANDFADLYGDEESDVARLRARLLFKTLIHPEGMGETFRVFIQHKGLAASRLAGLDTL